MVTSIEDKITMKQIGNMKHAIGFDRKKVKRGKYSAYRNYYTTVDRNQSWDELVELSFATRKEFKNGIGYDPQYYSLTRMGMDLLERVPGCKIVEVG